MCIRDRPRGRGRGETPSVLQGSASGEQGPAAVEAQALRQLGAAHVVVCLLYTSAMAVRFCEEFVRMGTPPVPEPYASMSVEDKIDFIAQNILREYNSR